MQMLSKKNTAKKKTPLHKKKGGPEVLITIVLIAVLTIIGITMSQINKDKICGKVKGQFTLVKSTAPLDKDINIATHKTITVTFSEDMNPATVNNRSFILMQGLNSISGTVFPKNSDATTFTFAPERPLTPFTVYTATIKKGVKNAMGNILHADYIWSFTTQPQLTLSSNPKEGGTTTGGGTFNSATLVTVNAVPAVGYIFTNWTEGTDVVCTNVDCAFALAANRAFAANFTSIAPQYTLMNSSNSLAKATSIEGDNYNSVTQIPTKVIATVEQPFKE